MRIDVLGVGFDNLTMAEAVERGAALLEEPGAHYVVTPNPEIVEVCRENPMAMQAVNGADLVLPDGIGVVKGAAMLGTPLKEKTPGIEFAAGLMEKMAERGRSLYLLGAKPGVADLAAERLQKQRAREKAYREKRKAERLAASGGELVKKQVCPQCGKIFIPASSHQTFCSEGCCHQARQNQKQAEREAERGQHYYRQRICAMCGSAYWPESSRSKFCSDACRKKNHNKVTLEAYHKKRVKEQTL